MEEVKEACANCLSWSIQFLHLLLLERDLSEESELMRPIINQLWLIVD